MSWSSLGLCRPLHRDLPGPRKKGRHRRPPTHRSSAGRTAAKNATGPEADLPCQPRPLVSRTRHDRLALMLAGNLLQLPVTICCCQNWRRSASPSTHGTAAVFGGRDGGSSGSARCASPAASDRHHASTSPVRESSTGSPRRGITRCTSCAGASATSVSAGSFPRVDREVESAKFGGERPDSPPTAHRTFSGNFNITAAVLASADHDLQIRRRPNANYGEAVGITSIYETSRDAPASLAPQHREIRLFGQFKWDYGRSDDRSGSGNLRQ